MTQTSMVVPSKRYVVGFMFDKDVKYIALIRKTHPAEQADLLNGVGGRIEAGETPVQAMVREAQEESGLESTKDDWLLFHVERNEDKVLYFYVIHVANLVAKVETRTEESMVIFPYESNSVVLGSLRRPINSPRMANLWYLLPMALCYLENPTFRYNEG